MFKRSIKQRAVARIAAGALGVALLFSTGAIPVFAAEPSVGQSTEDATVGDPTPTQPASAPNTTPAPSESAVDQAASQPVETPSATAEPVSSPEPTSIATPSTAPDEPAVTETPALENDGSSFTPTATVAIPSSAPAPAPKNSAPSVMTAASVGTYTVAATPDPAVSCEGSSALLDITVAPVPPGGGTVNIYHDDSFLWSSDVDASGSAIVSTDQLAGGTNSFRVDFVPAGATDIASTTTAAIEGRSSCADLSFSADHETAVSGETLVRLTANVYGVWDGAGSVTFTDEFNGAKKLGTVALADVDGDQIANLGVRLTGSGTHVLRATFDGSDEFGSTGSQTVTIEVTGDTGVAISGVGVAYSTFYPYKDNYRDTVAIRGTLLEPASVAIKIYAPSGRKVRFFTVTNREGGYSVAWNGRNSSGTRVAAGKYRVVQTIRDLPGHTRTVTSYTNVSNKRLYWSTGTLTKYGDQYSAYDYSTYGWVQSSYKYSRGVNLYGNIYDGYAYTGYGFTLPSAVKYGSLTFKVLGKPQSGYGVPYISVWNYGNQSEDGDRWVGRSQAWYSTTVSGAGHVSSRHVRGFVTTLGENSGFYDVAKVQLTYKYARLR